MGIGATADFGANPSMLPSATWPAPAGQVSLLFWVLVPIAAVCAAGAHWGYWAIDAAPVMLGAVGVMLIGGLPHGACDMALAAAVWRVRHRDLTIVVALYVAVAAIMVVLWTLAPVAALLLFLCLSAVHFGEDWIMLPSGLLRMMAGMAVISAAALGHQAQVTALFATMTGSPLAEPIAHWAAAAAPVTLLVTLVGLAGAWQTGHRQWVVAQAISYACLITLPPLLGFCVFFVGLHAPRHWNTIVARLPQARVGAAAAEGAALTALVLALWITALWVRGSTLHNAAASLMIGGEAFRLLSIVAAPHLAMSLAIDRSLARLRC